MSSADSTALSPAKANFADFSNEQIWMPVASVFVRFSADSTALSPAKANFADFSNQQIWMTLASVFARFSADSTALSPAKANFVISQTSRFGWLWHRFLLGFF